MKAKKSLGQHFLQDEHICDDIVASSCNITGKTVIEVGPGYGALTDSILKKNPARLILVEKDKMLAAYLLTKYRDVDNVTLLQEDALRVRIPDLVNEKCIIISNLPYNIASKLICMWLAPSVKKHVEHLTLMMQKEVVERICAEPNNKDYGRLSIFCQIAADVTKSFDVPKEAFKPMPKITSAIFQAKPNSSEIAPEVFKKFEQILRMCFSKRRKMLKSILDLSEEDFQNLSISPSQRPETLIPKDFLNIAIYLKMLKPSEDCMIKSKQY